MDVLFLCGSAAFRVYRKILFFLLSDTHLYKNKNYFLIKVSIKEISKKYGICIIQATNGSREFMELCL